MIGQTSGIEKEVKCTAAIATAYTIGKFGADDDTLSVASAATDNLIGIFQHITSAAADRVRVMLTGISRVKLGDTVTRGDPITSDASAKGVLGVLGNNIIGFALASGVANDIIPLLLMPGILNSPEGVDGRTFKGMARCTYDFAEHGGVHTTDIGLGVTLPDNAVITKGWYDVITACVSAGGTGTIALKANSAADLLTAVDADTLSGQGDLIPVSEDIATAVKLTAAREITVNIGTENLTAGKIIFFLEYVISE